ncbi:hypothetical protein M6B38_311965 [Iris pallida]|uniref:Uncharacterized protein n=1 Tax=Iris pallida TaxID=29817 RepID=A0AAX6HFR3_IRIPA|nr:hypothetical protein M6B38_311965 [Iris pallida]
MTRQQSHPSEKVEKDEAEMSRRWRFFATARHAKDVDKERWLDGGNLCGSSTGGACCPRRCARSSWTHRRSWMAGRLGIRSTAQRRGESVW